MDGAGERPRIVAECCRQTDALGLSGGRTGCTPNTDAACGTFSANNIFKGETTFRPRTVGVQVNYKY